MRGASFKNGMLVAALALGGAGFYLEAFQERNFTNKFGETIYEDILHLIPDWSDDVQAVNIAQSVATWCLDQANAPNEEVKAEILEAKKRANSVQKSPLFGVSLAPYHKTHSFGGKKAVKERNAEMTIYPTPHLEKLEATLANDKLPQRDRPQVEKAIQHYTQWIEDMNLALESKSSADAILEKMVSLLNQYRIHMDIDLIFNSQDDWLYRQKGS